MSNLTLLNDFNSNLEVACGGYSYVQKPKLNRYAVFSLTEPVPPIGL